MKPTIADVLSGTIGKFWAQRDDVDLACDGEPVYGVGQLGASGDFELKGLIAVPWDEFKDEGEAPQSQADYFVGETEHGALLLDGVVRGGSKVVLGGTRASTRRYGVRHVVLGLEWSEIDSRTLNLASLHWDGIAEWAGLKSVAQEIEFDPVGYAKSVTLHVAASDPDSIDLSPGTRLELGSIWTLNGPDDARVLRTPTRVSFVSEEGDKLDKLVHPLGRVQDLICVAYQGFVRASGGAVQVGVGREAVSRGDLWSRRSMGQRASEGAGRPARSPLFSLADLGGLPGLKRWLELCEEHSLLVRPLVAPYHAGQPFAEQTLIESCAAMDYWRGANKGQEPWATDSFQPRALAACLGEEFKVWVGDVEQWGKLLWYHYNGLKHYIPNYKYDASSVYHLALSAATVVMCAALQEVAPPGSKICDRLLLSQKITNRGERLRAFLSGVATS